MGKTVNDLVEFDCPFRVTEDGQVETGPIEGVYAPEVYFDGTPGGGGVDIGSDEWSAWSTGYTGQWSYSGPVMHDSEFIGGRLERDLLDDPGVYVVTSVECLGSDEAAGWIVLKHEQERPAPAGYVDCECCGITIIGRRKCDSCEAGECDPEVTWHCSGAGVHDCDGTVCPTTEAEQGR